MWVKKWICFLDWCDGGEGGGEAAAGGGQRFCNCLITTEIFSFGIEHLQVTLELYQHFPHI